MKRILITLLTVAISYCSFSQISQRCPVCPPRQGSSPDSSCLRIVNGVAVWLPCAGSTNDFWSLTGNAGTTPDTNYIGTADSKGLYFKTKNTTAIVVDTGQNVGIGVTNTQAKLDVLGTFHARHNGSVDSSVLMLGKNFIGLVPMDGLYTNKLDNRAAYIGYFDPSGFGANKNLGVVLYNNATSRANGLTVTKDQFGAVYWDSTGNWQFGTTGYGVDKHADLFSFYRPFGIDKSSFVSTRTTSEIRDYYRFDSLSNLKYTMILSHSTGISMGTGTGDNHNVSNLALHMDTNANVGIGTATPADKLDVFGTFNAFFTTDWGISNTVRLGESVFSVNISGMLGHGGTISIDSIGTSVFSATKKMELYCGDSLKLLIGGTQGEGKILTSDADGNASWQQHTSKVDLTNQTASITTTNISGTDSAGFYLLDFYLVNSVADGTAGNVTITITWNDGVAARSITSSALALTSNGFINHVTGATTENAIYKNGSGPIQFSTTATTVNSAAYDLHIRVEDGN